MKEFIEGQDAAPFRRKAKSSEGVGKHRRRISAALFYSGLLLRFENYLSFVPHISRNCAVYFSVSDAVARAGGERR